MPITHQSLTHRLFHQPSPKVITPLCCALPLEPFSAVFLITILPANRSFFIYRVTFVIARWNASSSSA